MTLGSQILHNLYSEAASVVKWEKEHILGVQLGSVYGDIAFLAHIYEPQVGIGRSRYGHRNGSAAGTLWDMAGSLSRAWPSAPTSPVVVSWESSDGVEVEGSFEGWFQSLPRELIG